MYTVTRAGPPGIQRYAQTWSGDNTTSWHMLRWNIRMGLTMSLSGMFNTGHDVGGFSGPVPDAGTARALGAERVLFSPRFIMNSWKAGGEVNTPWLHPDAIGPIREAIRLRYRFMPYLYTLYRRAASRASRCCVRCSTSSRTIRAPVRTATTSCSGRCLLVANVVEPGQRERRVYLPPRLGMVRLSGLAGTGGRE